MGKFGASHDFIKYFEIRKPRVFEIVAPLYKKGLSISEISAQTGIARSTVYAAIRAKRDVFRPPEKVPFERWRRGNPKGRRHPPFGFCYYNGALVEDPREYPTVQLIRMLKEQGKSITEITNELNRRGIPTRRKKLWQYGVVKAVLRRMVQDLERKSSTD